jgi:hypothetical protein
METVGAAMPRRISTLNGSPRSSKKAMARVAVASPHA